MVQAQQTRRSSGGAGAGQHSSDRRFDWAGGTRYHPCKRAQLPHDASTYCDMFFSRITVHVAAFTASKHPATSAVGLQLRRLHLTPIQSVHSSLCTLHHSLLHYFFKPPLHPPPKTKQKCSPSRRPLLLALCALRSVESRIICTAGMVWGFGGPWIDHQNGSADHSAALHYPMPLSSWTLLSLPCGLSITGTCFPHGCLSPRDLPRCRGESWAWKGGQRAFCRPTPWRGQFSPPQLCSMPGRTSKLTCIPLHPLPPQDKAQVLADVRSIISEQLGTELEKVRVLG